MGVMTTGVHDRPLFAQILLTDCGCERQACGLQHWQGIHVGAQGDDRAWFTAFQQADDASGANPGVYLHPQTAQVLGDERCGALLLIAQFRVLVDIVTPGDGFGLNSFCAARQALIE